MGSSSNLTEYFVWKKESSGKISQSILGVRKEWSCKIHIAICVMKWGHPGKYHRVTCVKQAISNKISHSILCERQKSSYKSHIVICVTKWGQAVISQSILCEKGSQAAKKYLVWEKGVKLKISRNILSEKIESSWNILWCYIHEESCKFSQISFVKNGVKLQDLTKYLV
jgi:hypothetical protein